MRPPLLKMTSAWLLLLVGCVLLASDVEAKTCYTCSEVSGPGECNNATVQCGDDEECFTERVGELPYAKFTLGCMKKQQCPRHPSLPFDLVRKQTFLYNCKECCSGDKCNDERCDFDIADDIQFTAESCNDLINDCSKLNTTIRFCETVHKAKFVCRKFCGLCDLVDGSWYSWSPWSKCSVSCGTGRKGRYRTCMNPPPANGGLACSGPSTDTQDCKIRECPVHGGWSSWSSWDRCTIECGMGLRKRHRECNNPTPSVYGNWCVGEKIDVVLCTGTNCSTTTEATPRDESCLDTMENCKMVDAVFGICKNATNARTVCKAYCGLCGIVDGQWADWSGWTTCTTSCGNGQTSRLRSCTNPAPKNGGRPCEGPEMETVICNSHQCPVHGEWSMWTPWAECSETCDKGLTHRRRECDNPRPSYFGTPCYGDNMQYSLCQVKPCLHAVVAFQAYNAYYSSSNPIKFRSVRVNEGNAYNPSTGIFRAPVKGLYQFSLTVMSGSSNYYNINKNGSSYGRIYTYRYRSSSARTIIDDLEKNDEITVFGTGSSDLMYFSGVLLYPK